MTISNYLNKRVHVLSCCKCHLTFLSVEWKPIHLIVTNPFCLIDTAHHQRILTAKENVGVVNGLYGASGIVPLPPHRYHWLTVSCCSCAFISVMEYEPWGPDILLLRLHQGVQSLVFVKIVEGYPWVQPFQVDSVFCTEKHGNFIKLQHFQEFNVYLYNGILRWFILQIVVWINYYNLTSLLITAILAVTCLITTEMSLSVQQLFIMIMITFYWKSIIWAKVWNIFWVTSYTFN